MKQYLQRNIRKHKDLKKKTIIGNAKMAVIAFNCSIINGLSLNHYEIQELSSKFINKLMRLLMSSRHPQGQTTTMMNLA